MTMTSTVPLQSPSLPLHNCSLPDGIGAETRTITVLKLRKKSKNKANDSDVGNADDDQTLAISNGQESEKVETSVKKQRTFSTFSVSLTKEKIEADILAMGGGSKRPTKRSKRLQNKLDHLFPGLCLKFPTPDDCSV